MDILFSAWGCVSDPVACASNIVAAVPVSWWFWSGLVIGIILGAIFDWWALILLVLAFLVSFLPRKVQEHEQHDLPFPDGLPPARKRQRRPTFFDVLRRKKNGD